MSPPSTSLPEARFSTALSLTPVSTTATPTPAPAAGCPAGSPSPSQDITPRPVDAVPAAGAVSVDGAVPVTRNGPSGATPRTPGARPRAVTAPGEPLTSAADTAGNEANTRTPGNRASAFAIDTTARSSPEGATAATDAGGAPTAAATTTPTAKTAPAAALAVRRYEESTLMSVLPHGPLPGPRRTGASRKGSDIQTADCCPPPQFPRTAQRLPLRSAGSRAVPATACSSFQPTGLRADG